MAKHANVKESRRFASGTRTGVRAAADFTIALGFTPKMIRVVNLTDRIEAEHVVDSDLGTANAESLLTIATGVRTYVDAGISLDANLRSFSVVVATAGLESADDDVYWEAWD